MIMSAHTDPLRAATPSLHKRLLGKIVNAGPATPCATWVGAYSTGRRRSTNTIHLRPVIQLGGRGSPVAYVAPTMLRLAGVVAESVDQREACHRCPTGTAHDAMYRCVDLAHLQWGSRDDNERDKRRPVSVDSPNPTD